MTMECDDILSEIEYEADHCTDEMKLKAYLINLNILESDLIQLGLIENVSMQILSIRLKINDRLGWSVLH